MASTPTDGLPDLPCLCTDNRGWYYGQDSQGREVVRRCPACQVRAVARPFGGAVKTWALWEPVPQLDAAVSRIRAWRGGQAWACLLHAEKGRSNFGSGKSHACQAIAHEWATRGVRIRYAVTAEFVDARRRVIDGDASPPDIGGFEGLVVLDDLGAESATDFARSVIDGVADARYRRRFPTLITSNLDLVALEQRYPRLVSRAHEGVVVAWSAPDWRRR